MKESLVAKICAARQAYKKGTPGAVDEYCKLIEEWRVENPPKPPRDYVGELDTMLARLKEMGMDVRIVRDNPQGTLTFQGFVKYAKEETTNES